MLSFIKQLTNELVQYDDEKIESYYLEYTNEFLTIDYFAEYHNFTRYEASKIIDLGRKLNERWAKV